MSSLRRTDLLTLANLRNDGRKPSEIRRTQIQIGPLSGGSTSSPGVSGSAIIQMGLTIALASVCGPTECSRRSEEFSDKASLEVNLRLAPFASSGGDRRVVKNPGGDRVLVEQSHLIKSAIEAAVMLHLYPRAKFEINILILADDGGRLCAAINAATLALVDAAIPMKDMVCACTAGLGGESGDSILVDLNRMERMRYGGESAVYFPCAIMPQRGTVVLSQCEARLPISTFENLLNAAVEGCEAVFEIMQASIRERASTLIAAHNGNIQVTLYEDEQVGDE